MLSQPSSGTKHVYNKTNKSVSSDVNESRSTGAGLSLPIVGVGRGAIAVRGRVPQGGEGVTSYD